MSSPMMPMRGPSGGPGGGMGPSAQRMPTGNANQAATAIRQNRSMANPTDAAALMQTGDIQPNMTIAQFFGKFGIDVNKDPVTKLAQFTQDQLSKANPMNKMSAIAGAPSSPGAPPGPGGSPGPAPGGSPAPGGLAALMQGQ